MRDKVYLFLASVAAGVLVAALVLPLLDDTNEPQTPREDCTPADVACWGEIRDLEWHR